MNKKTLTTIALATTIFASPFFSNNADAAELSHQVKSGDTLWGISQSYNVSVNDIRSWNNLSSNTIHVGQTIVVSPESNPSSSVYTVKAGDTLWSIANKNNMSVSALKSANNLKSDVLSIGQKLTISNGSTNTAPTPTPAEKTHTVKSGDSLWAIANKHGLTVDQVKSYNGLTSNTIHVGQVLKLTSNGDVQAPGLNVNALISEAKKHMGTPYVWGGTSPKGFDCSGFLHYVYLKQGVSIPRTVATIWNATTSVSSPKVGDIVFFETYKAGPSHAGIYLGNGEFIHASSSEGITISKMSSTYWKTRYLGAKAVN